MFSTVIYKFNIFPVSNLTNPPQSAGSILSGPMCQVCRQSTPEAVWGIFYGLAAREMPPGAEMPAASTEKTRCERYKWIGGNRHNNPYNNRGMLSLKD